MPSKRKGFQGAQKKKGQTKHAAQAFAKAVSDAAVAVCGMEEQLAASVGMSGPPGGC